MLGKVISSFAPNETIILDKSINCWQIKSGTVNIYFQIIRQGTLCENYYLGTASVGFQLKNLALEHKPEKVNYQLVYIASAKTELGIDELNEDTKFYSDICRLLKENYPHSSKLYDCNHSFYEFLLETINRDQDYDKNITDVNLERSLEILKKSVGKVTANVGIVKKPIHLLSEKGKSKLKIVVEFMLSYYGIRLKADDEYLNQDNLSYEERLTKLGDDDNLRLRKVKLILENFTHKFSEPILAFYHADEQIIPVVLYLDGKEAKAYDPETDKSFVVTKDKMVHFSEQGYLFYATFSEKIRNIKQVFKFISHHQGVDFFKINLLFFFGAIFMASLPLFASFTVNTLIPTGNIFELYEILLFLTIISVSYAAVNFIPKIMLHFISSSQYERLQIALLDKVLKSSTTNIKQYQSGELVTKILSTGTAFSNIATLLGKLISSGILVVVMILVMYLLAPKLSSYALIFAIVLIIFYVIFSIRNLSLMRHYSRIASGLSGFTRQVFCGLSKIKTSNAKEQIVAKFMQQYANLREMDYKISTGIDLRDSLVMSFPMLCTLIFFILASASDSNITIGELLGFLVSFYVFLQGLMGCISSFGTIVQVRPSLDQILPLVQNPSENQEHLETSDEFDGHIELSHISYGYSDSDLVLNDVSLEIKPGEFVAIVGGSGSGKSTLLKIILGLLTPNSGAVYYSERELSNYNLQSVRKNFGVILQSSKIFDGTIYDNVTLGNNISEKEIENALNQSGCRDMCEEFPMGIHTFISANSISGGQAQRILIARTLVSNPKVLVLDEATSALDNISQKQVQDNLEKMNISRIVVAHRISTIKNADCIYVLENGRIVEKGTYNELISSNGCFAKLSKKQLL